MAEPQAHRKTRKTRATPPRTDPESRKKTDPLRPVTYIWGESDVYIPIRGDPMWSKIDQVLAPLFRLCRDLDREEWVVVFVVALTIGYFCMRGFGSRSKY